MPYRICKIMEIESGHMLSKHPDKCKFPHGHTRQVEFVLEADDLDGREMVCDFKVIKLAVHDFVDSFDHAICMNTRDANFEALKQAYGDRVIGFEGSDPTTEVMAKTFHDHLKQRLHDYGGNMEPDYPLRKSVRIAYVRVWETRTSWAEYSEAF